MATLPEGLPTRWSICPRCDGDGESSAYLGAFTQDDWDQQDREWQDDYRAGKFDRPCEHCAGTGKIRIPDDAKIDANPKLRALRAEYEDDLAADAADRRTMLRECGIFDAGY